MRMAKNYNQLIIILLNACIAYVGMSLNTMPLQWNYHPSLTECGQRIFVCSNLTVPQSPEMNYTITFNQLINPTMSYAPAISFVDLKYIFKYNVDRYVGSLSFIPTSNSSFILTVGAVDANLNLLRFAINYLAVSQDMKTFFIWIQHNSISVNREINSPSPFVYYGVLGKAFPSTSNMKSIISITDFYFHILESASNLFDYQLNVNILNTTNYEVKVSSTLARVSLIYYQSNVIFFQSALITPYSQVLLIPVNFQSLTPATANNQNIYTNNLAVPYEVYPQNFFFTLSRITSIQSADFTVNLISNTQLHLNYINAAKIQSKYPFVCSRKTYAYKWLAFIKMLIIRLFLLLKLLKVHFHSVSVCNHFKFKKPQTQIFKEKTQAATQCLQNN